MQLTLKRQEENKANSWFEYTGIWFPPHDVSECNRSVQISEADVCRRKSSHKPDSKQHVINIDISLWQLQTPKFLSVPPQQTQASTQTHAHTLAHKQPFVSTEDSWVVFKACTVVRVTPCLLGKKMCHTKSCRICFLGPVLAACYSSSSPLFSMWSKI